MRVAVFSGTSEGKEVAAYLSQNKIEATVFVATEYGSLVMEEMPYITVNVGRLTAQEMELALKDIDLVIDATHPYAQLVTKNIIAACNKINCRYLRLLREQGENIGFALADNIQAAVELLKNTKGNIFVSTGSKELCLYTELDNYKKRLIARVLPTSEAREQCNSLGLENAIYKKGPFSYEDNYAAFKEYDIKWLVTKSSGSLGGFDEKINAAKALSINIIVIKRPTENGLTMTEVKKAIDNYIKEIN